MIANGMGGIERIGEIKEEGSMDLPCTELSSASLNFFAAPLFVIQ